MKELTIDILLKSLPNASGVYQFFDKEGSYLYVGKAKNLKKRVGSYFTKKHDTAKLRVMVKKVVDIKHIVVETEADALLLENNLIKRHQPRYNALLKDDKTFPWICIKNEAYPRVFYTRKYIKDNSEYFGPYTSMKTVNTLLQVIKEVYPLRSCKYNLSQEQLSKNKYKVCLEYQIKNCLGPCEKLQTEEDYNNQIKSINSLLRGNLKEIIASFTQQMKSYAEELDFEQAHLVKEKINTLKSYQEKTTIVSTKINKIDVFSIHSDPTTAYVNFLKISNGAIISSHNVEIQKKIEEPDEKLLAMAILNIRERFNADSKEIYLPFYIDLPANMGIKLTVPKIGDKKKLVELSLRNAKYFQKDRLKQMKIVDPERHTNRLMKQMKVDLSLPQEPRHIECFDNSNLHGTNPVSACVVFKNGYPSKKDYRHFNVQSVKGVDDFASMKEVVYRRYKRLLKELQPLPQLIVIDGGKGQLSSAVESLKKLDLYGKIAILGIAKKLEELFFPEDPYPLYLDKTSETLKIIQRLRDEAHRFGITSHRNKRSKNTFVSKLENIEGIGNKTVILLMREFKSIKRIKEIGVEQISKIVGKRKAQIITDYFESIDKIEKDRL